ncbi:MAG: HDIG domain-containing protein [Marinilabiliaceae bacterium]|nr:HDIG domain-containing protein [Marinilabiliaceae bacterium]
MNPLGVIEKYYIKGSTLYDIIVTHSSAVADLSLAIVDGHPELGVDRQFIYEGAMLHDIGIIRTYAPGIHCEGSANYICHGYLGSEMLQAEGLYRHALVCERHTGAGLPLDEIISMELPIPHRDMIPVSIEEQIICYADKFFSKSRDLKEQKSLDSALHSVAKYGEASERRFRKMHELFSIPRIV